MTPAQAYRRLNTLVWRGRLPRAVIRYVPNATMPDDCGVTLFDADFVRPLIILNSSDKKWAKTLVHEMLHVAEPELNHGKVFEALVSLYWRLATTNIRGLRNL